MKLLLISFEIIPKVLLTQVTRNHNKIPLFIIKHEYFQNSLFLSIVIEWNKLDNFHISKATNTFKKQILENPKSTFMYPIFT